MVRNKFAGGGAQPHSLSFCLGLTGCRGSDFSPRVLFQEHHSELCDLTKGTIIPTSKRVYKYSACWCNWHKTQTVSGVPSFPSFYTSTFQRTTSRITRKSRKFLALEVPMIPAGMQKRLSLFFPLKIMYFPGTVQTARPRHMRDLF